MRNNESIYWTPLGLWLVWSRDKFSTDKPTEWYAMLGAVHGLYISAIIAMIYQLMITFKPI